jgi:polar amino acid transport system substrate-binding protein
MSRSFRSYRTAAGAVAATLALALAGCFSDSGSSTVSEGCTPQHQFSTVQQGTLTVATYTFPPHTVIEGDQLSGIEGDLLNELARRECLTLVVNSAGGATAAVPSVQTGRADLAAGDWWRTKDRAKVVSLSDPLYLDQGAIVSKAGYKSLAELDGKKIGSVGGNLWNDELKKAFGNNFTVYQDGESVFNDLAAGRIDAVIDSVGATTARFQTTPIEGAQIIPLPPDPRVATSRQPGQVNWPTSKDNPELTAAINAQIAAMHADGTIVKTLEKYGLDASAADVGQPSEL